MPSPLTYISGKRRPTWRNFAGETAAIRFQVNMSLTTLVSVLLVALGLEQSLDDAQLCTTKGLLA